MPTKLTHQKILEDFKLVHGYRYDYTLVDYIDIKTKVCIICPDHGEFLQTPDKHKQGRGCPECGKLRSEQAKILDQEKVIKSFREFHGNKYDYSKVEYCHCRKPICIICPNHGEFMQIPDVHKRSGCPKCNESNGERKIRTILQNKKIQFETQKTFSNCKHKYKLRFDFFLPNYNLLIEYHGRQHFELVEHFGGIENFKKTQVNDRIKRDWVMRSNYDLLEIHYDDNTTQILEELLS
jgi:hypothetical protein